MKKTISRILAAAALVASFPATATEYLIAPLIGDRLNIVFALMTTGSNLRTTAEVIKLPQLPWDDAIKDAVIAGVTAADEKATFKQLAFREGLPGVEILDQADENEIVAALIKAMGPVIDPGKKQWIVALWPRKTEHNFKLSNMHIGRGRNSGIGFYVDRATGLISGSTSEADVGFLGMFAYFDVALIDPATQKVLAKERSVTTRIYAMADGGRNKKVKKDHPWELLTAEQKIQVVQRVVTKGVNEAMPPLMKSIAGSKK